MPQSTMILNRAGQVARPSDPACGSPLTWEVNGNSPHWCLIPVVQSVTTRGNTVSKSPATAGSGASRLPRAQENARFLKSSCPRQRPAMCASASTGIHAVNTGQSTNSKSILNRFAGLLTATHPAIRKSYFRQDSTV